MSKPTKPTAAVRASTADASATAANTLVISAQPKSRQKVPKASAAPTGVTRNLKKAKTPTAVAVETNAPSTAITSKLTTLLELLKRPKGATLAEMMEATNWQAHSVRGFLSATVRKKMALPLVAELRATGERVYRISAAVDEPAHA